jgi:4-amino-4-deoxy-L-arabinose transferase-like glycosyltransferase
MSWNRTSISILITVLALGLTLPFIGMSHLFDWDEVNFAEAAREMLLTGDYTFVQINFKPFWEKPPLFIWMQAVSMGMFGVNEFAARLPNAICASVTLVLLFNIGNNLVSKNFGLLWTLVFAGSLLPQFYFRTGIIDPWFNLFIFSGIHFLAQATAIQDLPKKHLLFSAFLIGLAVMTKGPTALGIVGICCAVYFILNLKQHSWKLIDPLLYLSVVLLIGFSWFGVEILRGHGHVVKEFIDYHIRLFSESEAGHGQPFFYHPLVLLIGCFPMSLFFIFRWFNKHEESETVSHYAKWMSILFWVVLIVFSIVKTKIIHYSSLTYFPMSFLATLGIYQLLESKWKFSSIHQILLLFFIAFLGSVFVLAGVLDSIKPLLLSLLEANSLAFGNFNQNIPDRWFEPLIGLGFMVAAMASAFLLLIGKTKKGIYGLFGSTLITVSLLSIFIGPKMDRYLQKPLFDFYKEHAASSYLAPIGFHSYAHLYYGQRTRIEAQPEDELKWMIFEKVDKPIYFISRAHDLETTLVYFPHLQEIDRKGGYVILERTDEGYPFLGER